MSVAGQQITVLGAGVAGLCVARALALKGAEVTLLEQADAIREVGAGLQISPNGAAVLRALGLGAALEAASMRAPAIWFCGWIWRGCGRGRAITSPIAPI